MPKSFKAAAGLAICFSSLNGISAVAETNSTPPLSISTPASPLIIKGLYGSKASGGKSTKRSAEISVKRSLNWLSASQNPDGSWGSEQQKVLLTSLVTLAFLSRGETPASEQYGRNIENALRLLVKHAEQLNGKEGADKREKAALIWCLSEAYGMTRIPPLQTALQRTPRIDKDDPAPWRVIAAKALRLSGADDSFDQKKFADLCPDPATLSTNELELAFSVYITSQTRGRKEAMALTPSVPSPNDWTKSDTPFLHAYFLEQAFFTKGGQDYLRWRQSFDSLVTMTQQNHENKGWWTLASLKMAHPSETSGMTEADSSLYATAWMILCLPPSRFLPIYQKEDGSTEMITNKDIVIRF